MGTVVAKYINKVNVFDKGLITFDAVILSNTKSQDIYMMTCHAIKTLFDSIDNSRYQMNVILVESNVSYDSSVYPYENANVFVLDGVFNFHEFLNFGIKQGISDYVGLFNNDLIFHEGWLDKIISIADKFPDIKSFGVMSPMQMQNYNRVSFNENRYSLGYRVEIELSPWAIVVKRDVLHQMGYLDQRFNFYYADNDYAMELRRMGILHALVKDSYISHLGSKSSADRQRDALDLSLIPKFYRNLFSKRHRLLKDLFMNPDFASTNRIAFDGFKLFYNKWYSSSNLYLLLKVLLEAQAYRLRMNNLLLKLFYAK